MVQRHSQDHASQNQKRGFKNMVDQNTSIRVLLADDHAVVRAGIRQILEHAEDIKVVAEAEDGEEAERLIAEHVPDVAVLDIQMPKASGIEVTRWVRAHHREVGVLILTAYDDDPYVFAVLQAGANGYVLKTASPAEIIQAVRDVHEGKSALDPAITQKLLAQITSQRETPLIEHLTEREMEVLTLVAKGYTNKAIGAQLDISDRTVQGHLAKIFTKMNASSRTEAVMRAISFGWLPSDLGIPNQSQEQ
jgi:DNA-binding NarL/FixJ family response regulator